MLDEYSTGSPRTGRRPATAGPLVRFHTAHKLTLMAHSPKHYTEMGRLVADAGKRDWDELTAEYGAQLAAADRSLDPAQASPESPSRA